MHKMLIVLLAVCLVSTQAFVKRDAPAAGDTNYLETIQKKLQDLSKDFNSQLSTTFDPEAMKKNLNAIAESVNKAAHAFVKRDVSSAAAEVQAQAEAAAAKLAEVGTGIKDSAAKALDPDAIKKNFNEFVDAASKTVASLRSSVEGPAPKPQ